MSCSQGTSIHLWDCFDDRSQVLGNGECRARCDRGTNIQLWERNRSAAQKLLYNFTDEIICSVSCNGKALDILQITASGTNIWLYDINDEWSKKWEPVFVWKVKVI